MDFNAIDIQELIIADISGSITNEEKDRLNKLMTENSAVRDRYEVIKRAIAHQNTDAVRESHTTASQLLEMAKRRRGGRTINIFALAAASMTGVIIIGGLIYYSTTVRTPQLLASQFDKNHVVLKLGNQTVDLECKNCETNASGYAIHSDIKQLTYTGTSADQTTGTLIVPPGKSWNVVLEDGTVVSLNAASKLEFPMKFNGHKREITISGEAYLQVAKKADQPFIVHLNNGNYVQVLGTAFNVNTYDSGKVQVSLVEGSVKMNTGNDSVLLKPGSAAIYEGTALTVNEFDEEEVLSWKSGMLKFTAATIDQIAASVIPRYFKEKLVIDPSASGKKFTGVIDINKPLKEFLSNLTTTNEISHYTSEDGVIHLK